MKAKLTAGAAAIALALGAMPFSAFAEGNVYQIWVNDVQVTDENRFDVLGDDTVYFDSSTYTLEFYDATLTKGHSMGSMNVAIGVSEYSPVTITGTVTVEGNNGDISGFWNNGDKTIFKNVDFVTRGTSKGITAFGFDIDVIGSTFDLQGIGDWAFSTAGTITLSEGSILDLNSNGYALSAGKVVIGDGVTVEAVTTGSQVIRSNSKYEHPTDAFVIPDGYTYEPEDAEVSNNGVMGSMFRLLPEAAYKKVTVAKNKESVYLENENGKAVKTFKIGTKVYVYLVNSGYLIKSIDLDGTDITAEVKENGYFIMPENNAVLTVEVRPYTEYHEEVPATCEETGTAAYYEDIDGNKFFDADCTQPVEHDELLILAALGHDWDEGKVTKPATEEEEGVMTYTCRHDATHIKTEAIPKLEPSSSSESSSEVSSASSSEVSSASSSETSSSSASSSSAAASSSSKAASSSSAAASKAAAASTNTNPNTGAAASGVLLAAITAAAAVVSRKKK